MYRIARDAGQSRERRAQATHPARVRPELVAHGPSQVWSWDITALKGPQKGQWYKLYVVLDIFSRYVPGWLVAHAEDAVVAKDSSLMQWPVTWSSRTRSTPTGAAR
jgi:transposase InsO family protein